MTSVGPSARPSANPSGAFARVARGRWARDLGRLWHAGLHVVARKWEREGELPPGRRGALAGGIGRRPTVRWCGCMSCSNRARAATSTMAGRGSAARSSAGSSCQRWTRWAWIEWSTAKAPALGPDASSASGSSRACECVQRRSETVRARDGYVWGVEYLRTHACSTEIGGGYGASVAGPAETERCRRTQRRRTPARCALLTIPRNSRLDRRRTGKL